MRLAIVMDSPQGIVAYKDTTLAICLAAQKRNWCIDYIASHGLEIRSGDACAQATTIEFFDRNDDFYAFGNFSTKKLADEYDLILMRQDPPVNQQYMYNLMVLQLANRQGVLVANDPEQLLQRNEKIGVTEFPAFAPPTIVSVSKQSLKNFAEQHSEIICKPLDGMGGRGIFRTNVDDQNFNSIVETLSEQGTRMIMAQKYIPQIREGDKRIFLFDGDPWPYALVRIPIQGEVRANLAVGGTGITRKLTARDREIAQRVGKKLAGKGLYFVGIDVIGEYLTEVNITSPTGAREMMRDTNVDPTEKLLDILEKQIKR